MFESCTLKQHSVKALFAKCTSDEDRYKKIIELGKELPPFAPLFKTEKHLVRGCQSNTYLASELKDGVVLFAADSDALISKGLAALLIHVYNGETPETILKCPPDFLDELGIGASLTPSRANGLYSIHLRMKQDALTLLAASLQNRSL